MHARHYDWQSDLDLGWITFLFTLEFIVVMKRDPISLIIEISLKFMIPPTSISNELGNL